MTNTRFYLFRHGETFATKNGTGFYGFRIFSAPILEEGKPSIKKMGQYLKTIPSDYNVSSPLKRCRQTTEIITAETGKGFVFDKRLSELFIETPGHFQRRVKSFLDEVETHDYQTVIICTHAAVIAKLTSLLIPEVKLDSLNSKFIKPGVLQIIENGKIEEIDFN